MRQEQLDNLALEEARRVLRWSGQLDSFLDGATPRVDPGGHSALATPRVEHDYRGIHIHLLTDHALASCRAWRDYWRPLGFRTTDEDLMSDAPPWPSHDRLPTITYSWDKLRGMLRRQHECGEQLALEVTA